MHELGITQSIIDQIATATEGKRVTDVRLEIGKLSGVATDSIYFCFELIAEGTPLDGATLRIDEPLGRAECLECGATFVLEDLFLLCPCGSADVRVIDGRQLLIKSVEVL